MSKIPDPIIPVSVFNQKLSGKQNQIANASFDDLISSNDSSYQLSNNFLDNITNSLNDNFSDISGSFPATLPFLTDFQSTFGITGPLPAFINMITAQLHLTPSQNQAFQKIAVQNKDITKTPSNIQKLADELKQAGIIKNS